MAVRLDERTPPVHAHDYLAAIVFGLVIGVVARLLLPGRQNIGLVVTVIVGMLAAVAGTWVADHYDIRSTHRFAVTGHHYDWAVVGVQVGIAVVGVAVAAVLARAFSTDRERDRR
jgi:uncharacterized membrane protein YeaQ/YmgE (transglycosylase-associated protein family)